MFWGKQVSRHSPDFPAQTFITDGTEQVFSTNSGGGTIGALCVDNLVVGAWTGDDIDLTVLQDKHQSL